MQLQCVRFLRKAIDASPTNPGQMHMSAQAEWKTYLEWTGAKK
jgi:hypothetical protein